MKTGWIFWKLECKKYIKMIPFILLESVIFGFILLAFGIYASKSLYGERSMGVIRIGVVSEEESSLSGMLVNFVSSMESMEESCRFVTMEREQAYEALSDGSIYAAVILPEGMVESILNGTNLPATVVFGNTYSKVETAVFKEMAGAGERLLATAQAGIYAADALCIRLGQSERIQEAEDILNVAYLRYALRRAEVFDLREVVATGGMGTKGYYTVSLLLVFLSFAGITMGRYATVRIESFQRVLGARGLGLVRQYLLEGGAFATVFGCFGFLVALPFLQWYLAGEDAVIIGLPGLALLFLTFMMMGIFIRIVIQITGNSPGGMGAAFLLLLALMVASGLFIPTAFLPVWIERAGRYSPYTLWMNMMWEIVKL